MIEIVSIIKRPLPPAYPYVMKWVTSEILWVTNLVNRCVQECYHVDTPRLTQCVTRATKSFGLAVCHGPLASV